MLNKTKTLNTNSWIEEGQRKSHKMNQTGKEPYENNSEKNRALQMATKNNKTTKKNSSDRRRPS